MASNQFIAVLRYWALWPIKFAITNPRNCKTMVAMMAKILDPERLKAQARWYVLQSKPREEKRALENLRNQGFECLLPMYSRERLRRGKREQVDEPLFPRYLFVHLDQITSNWYVLRSTYGVTNIVRFGQIPAAISDDIVARFVHCNPADRHLFKPGEAVDIARGPFAGLEGVYDQDDGEQRVIILLDFMSKQQRLSLPVGDIAKH